jgi:outer membrane protein assembly factor BamB
VDLKADCWASPMCVDGKVYIPDGQGYVHIYEQGKTKKLLKKLEMDKGIKVPIVVANGTIYVTTEEKLYAISAK